MGRVQRNTGVKYRARQVGPAMNYTYKVSSAHSGRLSCLLLSENADTEAKGSSKLWILGSSRVPRVRSGQGPRSQGGRCCPTLPASPSSSDLCRLVSLLRSSSVFVLVSSCCLAPPAAATFVYSLGPRRREQRRSAPRHHHHLAVCCSC